MGVVPVRDVIVRGYAFFFARFFTFLGLGWLPAVLYGIACSYLIYLVGDAGAHGAPASSTVNQYSLGYFIALMIVTAFFGAPMLIPFTREALGRHEETVAAHFSYGPREWRLFVALLRLYGILGVTLFVLIVASGIGISQLSGVHATLIGFPVASWLNSLSAIVVIGVGLLLSVRLGFFLAPMAAVEGQASIARAWALSRGNFARLAAIHLSIIVPAAIIVLIAEYALWGSELAIGAGPRAIFRLQYDHAVGIAVMLAIALTVVNALFAGASAVAYGSLDLVPQESETYSTASESSWGIHRAPAYADAQHRIEPGVAQHEPAAGRPQFYRADDDRYGDVAIERASTIVEPEPPAGHEPPAKAMAETERAAEPVESASAPLAGPADVGLPRPATRAGQIGATVIETSLDPAGLSHAGKEHETA